MTENKPIMIDEVDVSKCEFYNTDDKTCREVNGKYDTDICEFDKCENSNCRFKQLARKTQECERLKYDNDYQVGALEKTIDNLKVENEELKVKCKTFYEFNRELIKEKFKIQTEEIETEEKLEKIREVVNQMNNECFYNDFDCKDCDMKNGCTYLNKRKVLQIIDEVMINE